MSMESGTKQGDDEGIGGVVTPSHRTGGVVAPSAAARVSTGRVQRSVNGTAAYLASRSGETGWM